MSSEARLKIKKVFIWDSEGVMPSEFGLGPQILGNCGLGAILHCEK